MAMAEVQCFKAQAARKFDPFTFDGVKPTLFQKWRRLLDFNPDGVSGVEARARYAEVFHEIFDDIHPVFLARAKTSFEKLPNLELGRTGQRSHDIKIDAKLKNHPLYPVMHAHELSHVYDLEIGRLSSFAKLSEEILDSEIRAHYRQLIAANKIFSKADLIKIRGSERNKDLKAYIDTIIQYGEKPDQYIAILFLMTEYQQLVYEVSGETTLEGKASFLLSRIHSVLNDLP